jgi:hypothetical protein
MRVACRYVAASAIVSLPSTLGSPSLARASSPGEGLPAIEYTAPPGCVDSEAFRSRLAERSPGLAALPPAQTERVSVEIVRTQDDRYQGTLHVARAEGGPFERRIEADACGEVVDALALVTLLAVGLEPSVTFAAEAPPPAPARTAERSPTHRPVEHASGSPRWTVGGGVHAAMVTVLGPNVQPGIEAYVAVAADRASAWSPEVRVSGWRLQSGTFDTAVGTAALTLLAAALDGCPLRLPVARDLALRPCAGVQLGSVQGTGEGSLLSHPRSQSLSWWAAFGVARIAWTLLPNLVFEGEAGVVIPLGTHGFYFGPDTTIYNVPAVGALATVGLGAHFP